MDLTVAPALRRPEQAISSSHFGSETRRRQRVFRLCSWKGYGDFRESWNQL